MAPKAKPKTYRGKGNTTPPNAHAAAAPGRKRRMATPARTGQMPAKGHMPMHEQMHPVKRSRKS